MNNSIIYDDCKKIVDSIDMHELENKSILITGATGLIGTYFLFSLREFISRGNKIDKVYITSYNDLPMHLRELTNCEWLQILKGDLTSHDFCESLPKADYIIHAAGYGQPAKFTVDEDKTIKLNTYVTFLLLDKLNTNGKFLFISSSGIYNGLNKEVFDETDVGTTNTLHPRACYIEGKRCGETICNAYRKKGINAKAARVSYSYGPGVRKQDERALYSFIKKAMTGEIQLLDDGSAQRIYCYIGDVVKMLWNILLFGREEIYNVGGEDKVTIKELADIIGDNMNATVSIPNIDNAVPGNACVERLNIEKVKKEFSIDSFVSLKEGILRTISWMVDNNIK